LFFFEVKCANARSHLTAAADDPEDTLYSIKYIENQLDHENSASHSCSAEFCSIGFAEQKVTNNQ
jgi:hypothetical protein